MTNFTRRTLVKGGTAVAAAGALTGPALLDWAKAGRSRRRSNPRPAHSSPCCAGNISCSPKTMLS